MKISNNNSLKFHKQMGPFARSIQIELLPNWGRRNSSTAIKTCLIKQSPLRFWQSPSMSRLQASDARVSLEARNKWSHDQSTAWAAVVVQRALRTRWQVYSLFGPELFVDSRGAAGQCGAIAFPGGSKVAFWIKVRTSTRNPDSTSPEA